MDTMQEDKIQTVEGESLNSMELEGGQGECDKCAISYDLSSRDNRCGNCGNCGTCCTHEGEGESVKIMGALLLELLEGVSSHAGRDKSLPTLNAVELEGGGGLLIARATDRYRLIEGQARALEGYLECSLDKALISLEDTKRIITLLKDQKSSIMSVTRESNSLTVSVLDNSVRVRVMEGALPPVDHLFKASEGETIPIASVAFNPAFFTDYAKIAGKGAAVKVYFTGNGKPMRVQITNDTINWRALLMPMRYTD